MPGRLGTTFICIGCGSSVTGNFQKNRTYCSNECNQKTRPRKIIGERICPQCEIPFYATLRRAVYCSLKCSGKAAYKAGRLSVGKIIPVADLFWPKVDKAGPVPEHRPDLGPCWLWTAYISKAGYGSFNKKGKYSQGAHRTSWELTHGRSIPDGKHLDHLCHTGSKCINLGNRCPHRRCVNPSHLEVVSPQENSSRANLDRLILNAENMNIVREMTNQEMSTRDIAKAINGSESSVTTMRRFWSIAEEMGLT